MSCAARGFGLLALVVIAMTFAASSTVAPGRSGAQAGSMHNCPLPGKWSIAVWEGASGMAAGNALAACGPGAVAAAYSLDPQTGARSRWFAGKPDVSNLPPLDDKQGVLALGGTVAAAAGDTLATAQAEGELHNCPPPGKWSIAVWEGASGTAADDALAACGEGSVAAAYSLDPQTGAWSRWFAGKPDVSNLPPLDDKQGLLALGSAAGPVSTPTPSATPTHTPTPTAPPVVYVPPPPSVQICIYQPQIPSIWPWGNRWAEVQGFADELEPEYEAAIQTASLDVLAFGSCSASGLGDFWDVDCHSSSGPDLRCDIWYWSDSWADIDCDEYQFADELRHTQMEAVAEILEDEPDVVSCSVSGIGSFLHIGCFTVYGGHFTCDATYIGDCADISCRPGY